MEYTIEMAVELGYKRSPDLGKWRQIQRIGEWMFERYSIYTWAQPKSDMNFTPYYHDLRMSNNKKAKQPVCASHQEALIVAIIEAIKSI